MYGIKLTNLFFCCRNAEFPISEKLEDVNQENNKVYRVTALENIDTSDNGTCRFMFSDYNKINNYASISNDIQLIEATTFFNWGTHYGSIMYLEAGQIRTHSFLEKPGMALWKSHCIDPQIEILQTILYIAKNLHKEK